MDRKQDNTHIAKLIGDKVRHYRTKNKIKSADLAKALDISRVSIINIEQGRHLISIISLMKLAKIFDVGYDALLPNIETAQADAQKLIEQRLLEENEERLRKIHYHQIEIEKLQSLT